MNNKIYKMMNWPKIEEIIYSEAQKPKELLGPHKVGNQTLIQAFFPGAKKVNIHFLDSKETVFEEDVKMECADEDGYFACLIPSINLPVYEYEVIYDKTVKHFGECYRFDSFISKEEAEKFIHGINYNVYEKLGAHPTTINGVKGTAFAVWAPNAMRVSVVGDFNDWDGRIHQMNLIDGYGIFELFIPDAKLQDNYKYEIKVKGGLTYLKSDPYANASQLRPDNASVITDISKFKWTDSKFIENRTKFQNIKNPMSVYELYLGSFTVPGKDREYANYREIADDLIPYIKKMGYTHVELMPIMEHPLDNSWGYQVIGYYAPTARYGTPEDFMYFINEMHKASIGVILDWVPAHFPRDIHGLSNFDGTCLYEHRDPRQGFHPHWGTLIYNYGRPEVSNYLIANALFWVEKYHADGIRFDAVASMLYLDYGRNDGEWIANIYGGNENLEAIEFIKHLNSIIHKRNPGVLTIAEESTAFPKITGSLDDGGLGFDLKWNMGFMNDYLQYIKYDPYFRSYHHGELTFSMIYAYSENFQLVFSHDEVVHGKATMLGKMPGDIKDKFANLRLTYGYMMAHPGKKLLFMGQDIGEFDEWNEKRQVQWNLLDVPEHKGISELVSDLNTIYTTNKAFYEEDDNYKGFEWINNISAQDCYLSFLRKGTNPEDVVLVVANFSGIDKEITTGVPFAGKYKEIFNSDALKYGGSGVVNKRLIKSKFKEWDTRENCIKVKLSALSISFLQYIPFTDEEIKKEALKVAQKVEKKMKEQTKIHKEH